MERDLKKIALLGLIAGFSCLSAQEAEISDNEEITCPTQGKGFLRRVNVKKEKNLRNAD